MATPIRIKRSAVSGKRPQLTDLQVGELALNTYDGSLFTERDTGGVGIATTVSNLTPWTESYGASSISYLNSVGIGTTNSVAKLDVAGKILAGDSITHPNLSNTLDTSAISGVTAFRPINLIDTSSLIKLARLHDDFGPGLDLLSWDANLTTLRGRSLISMEGGDLKVMMRDGSSTLEKLRITSAGKVGIGTTNPADPLHIFSNEDGQLRLESADNGAVYQQFYRYNSGISTRISYFGFGGTGNDISLANEIPGGDILFKTTPLGASAGAEENALQVKEDKSVIGFGNLNISGISTFGNNIDANGIIEGIAGENKIPSLYANLAALPDANTYHGMFAHVHSTGRGYFAHAGNWLELVNKDTSGNVALSNDLNVEGNVSIAGTLTYEDVTNVDSVGLITARSGIHVVGGGVSIAADGLNVSGISTFEDNVKITGTGNVIIKGTGNLQIEGSGPQVIRLLDDTGADGIQIAYRTTPDEFTIENQADGSKFFLADRDNRQVELYNSNVKRLETTGVGITVFGNTETQTLNVSGVSTFGSSGQAVISDNGNITATAITISDGQPGLFFVDTGANPDFVIQNRNGTFAIRDTTSNVNRFLVNAANGDVTVTGGLDVDGHTNLDNVSIAEEATFSKTVGISSNLNVTGVSTFQDDIFVGVGATVGFGITAYFRDNAKAVFGDDENLSIYYDGSNSYVEEFGLGQFYIRGSAAIHLENSGGSKKYFRGVNGGTAELFFDGDKKIETTEEGILVSGGTTTRDFKATGVSTFVSNAEFKSSVGIGTDDPQVKLHIQDTKHQIRLSHIESGSSFTDAGVIFKTNDSQLGGVFTEVDGEILSYGINVHQLEGTSGINTSRVGGIFRLDTRTGGGFGDKSCFVVKGRSIGTTVEHNSVVIDLDDGNTFLSPSKGSVAIGTVSPQAKLDVYDNSTGLGGIIQVTQDGTGDAAIDFQLKGTREYSLGIDNDDEDKFKLSGSAGLSNNTLLTVTNDGKVGIKSTAPQTMLDVIDNPVGRTWAPLSSTVAMFERNGGSLITLVSGTSSVVGIDFADSGDNNRGFIHYDHSDNSMFFRTNAAEQLRIKSDGNIGIGTDDPTEKLHLAADSAFQILLKRSGANPSEAIFGNEGNTTRISNNKNGIDFRTGSTPSSSMFIDQNGEVGIGTDNPGHKLHVQADNPTIALESNTTTGNTNIVFGDSGSDTQGRIQYHNNGDYMRFFTNGNNERLRIKSDGGTALTRTHLGGRTSTGGNPNGQNYYKIGTWKGFDLGSRAKITIFGTGTFNAGENVAGETVIYLALAADETLHGHFHSVSHTMPGVQKVIYKLGNSNTEAEIWIKYEVNYSMTKCMADVSIGTWEAADDDTGSTNVATGATDANIDSRYAIFTSDGTNSKERFRVSNDGSVKITDQGGSSNTPSLQVNNTAAASFIHSMQALTPNMTTGQQNIIILGKARSAKNTAFLGYKYSSAGSNDNLFTINHWGAEDLLTVNGQGDTAIAGDLNVNGNVSIGGTLTYEDVTNIDSIGIITARDKIKLTASQGQLEASGPTGLTLNASNASAYARIKVAGDTRLHIKNDGNIGIGTDDPIGTDALAGNTATLAVGILTANTIYGNVVGGLSPTGNIFIGGNLDVDGDTDLDVLNVSDTATFTSNLIGYGNVGFGTVNHSAVRLKVTHDGLDKVIQQWGGYQGSTAGHRFMELYSPENDDKNDYFKFKTGNAIKFRIDDVDAIAMNSNGAVGVGTDNPTQKLEVKYGEAWIDNNSGDSIARSDGLTVSHLPNSDFAVASDPGDSKRAATFAVKGPSRAAIVSLRNIDDNAAFWDFISDGNTNKFYIQRGSAVGAASGPAVTIDTSLNVGIGTDNPQTKLHIRQAIDNNSDGFRISRVNSAASYSQYIDTSARFNIGYSNPSTADPDPQITLSQNGYVGIGTNLPQALLDISSDSPNLRITDLNSSAGAGNTSYTQLANINGNTYVYTRANENNGSYLIGGQGNGVFDEFIRITQSGKVGIGTNNPTAPLHVVQKTTNTYGTGVARFEYYDTDDNGGTGDQHYDVKFIPTGTYFKTFVTGGGTDFLIVDEDNFADRASFAVEGGGGTVKSFKVMSDGNVGIGLTNPATKLDVQTTTQGEVARFRASNNLRYLKISSFNADFDGSGYDFNATSTGGALRFSITSDEKLRITKDGNVGINSSVPQARLDVVARGDSAGGIFITDSNDVNSAPYLRVLGKRRDGNTHQNFSGRVLLASLKTDGNDISIGINTNRKIGTIMFGGNHTDASESNILYPASMAAVANDRFSSATSMPTDLVFYTGSIGRTPNASNVSSGEERLRITSGGVLKIERGSASDTALEINTTSTSNACRIRFNESGTEKAQIAYSHDNDKLELIAHSGNQISFFTDGTEKVQLNTSGDLLRTGTSQDIGASGAPWDVGYFNTLSATTGNFSGNVSVSGTLTYEDVTNIDSVGLITARSGLIVTAGVSTFNDKVGIGNTIPNATLEVNGSIKTNAGTYQSPHPTGDTRTDVALVMPTDSAIYIEHPQAGIGTYLRKLIGEFGDGVIQIGQDSTAIIKEIRAIAGDTGFFSVYSGTNQRLGVTTNGSVNIGGDYTQATNKLQVTGNAKIIDGDLTISKSSSATLTVETSEISSYDALIKIRGARTGLTNDTSMLQFDNSTSSAYTMAQIAAQDPVANHTQGKGQLIFRTNKGFVLTERMRIGSDGNVGIGTNNPSAKLHIGPVDGDSTPHLYLASQNNDYGFRIDTDDFLGGNVPLRIFARFNGNDTERIRVKQNGNVGIGTDDPDAPLHIVSSVDGLGILSSTDSGANLDLYDDTTQSRIRTVDGRLHIEADKKDVEDNSEIRFFVDGTRQVSISSEGHIFFSSDTDNYFHRPAANNLAFVTADEERLRIKGDGNVGIGTNNPDFPLHVFHPTANNIALFESGDAFATMGLSDSNGSVSFLTTLGSLRIGVNGDAGTIGDNSTLAMTIKNNGNVGIGTDDPKKALHVINGVGSGYTVGTFNARTAAVIDGDNSAGTTLSIISKASGFSGLYFGRPNSEARGQLQYVHSDDAFRIITNAGGMDALRITSDNKVGINTDAPDSNLEINRGSEGKYLTIGGDNANNGRGLSFTSSTDNTGSNGALHTINAKSGNGAIALATAGTEALRIDSNGRILIGHSSTPTAALSLAVVGSYGGSSTNTPFVYLCRDEDATSIGANESLGQILFASRNGYRGAVIEANATGTWSGSSSDGYLVFKTTPDNTTVPAERLRIDSSGDVGIGTDDPSAKLDVRAEAFTKAVFKGTGANANNVGLFINSGDNAAQIANNANSTLESIVLNANNNSIIFKTTDTEALRIQADGDVGIGIANPTHKLEVNGSFAATTKSFVIDHPTKEGMKLRYGSLEGPENGVYVRGRLKDNNTIELPDYWTGLVDEDTITVNLTPIGNESTLHKVIDIYDNTVVVGSEDGNINCFYTVFGERKDVEKMEVEY